MSVSTVCQLCENREGTRTCGNCGRVVCDRHFDDPTGVCADCVSASGPGPEREREPDGPGDDVLRY